MSVLIRPRERWNNWMASKKAELLKTRLLVLMWFLNPTREVLVLGRGRSVRLTQC